MVPCKLIFAPKNKYREGKNKNVFFLNIATGGGGGELHFQYILGW